MFNSYLKLSLKRSSKLSLNIVAKNISQQYKVAIENNSLLKNKNTKDV